jgi:hypothetical protein
VVPQDAADRLDASLHASMNAMIASVGRPAPRPREARWPSSGSRSPASPTRVPRARP